MKYGIRVTVYLGHEETFCLNSRGENQQIQATLAPLMHADRPLDKQKVFVLLYSFLLDTLQ